ncbi:hypothetical protein [Embleya sp. MST-111070]|uniref:hypothetical protein n=1 Tax=Embleya sp. MST-111070 TaxID=3398231 RepID=UPI003F7389C5
MLNRTDLRTTIVAASRTTFDDVPAINARGVFPAMKYEIPHLIARGGGVVVVASSSAVDVVRPPGPPTRRARSKV